MQLVLPQPPPRFGEEPSRSGKAATLHGVMREQSDAAAAEGRMLKGESVCRGLKWWRTTRCWRTDGPRWRYARRTCTPPAVTWVSSAQAKKPDRRRRSCCDFRSIKPQGLKAIARRG